METIINFIIMIVFLITVVFWVIMLVKSNKNERCIVTEKECKECPFPCEEHKKKHKN